jgi:hypothetical protein
VTTQRRSGKNLPKMRRGFGTVRAQARRVVSIAPGWYGYGAHGNEKPDFPGFGPNPPRPANITWQQDVGGSNTEPSKIAGHANQNHRGVHHRSDAAAGGVDAPDSGQASDAREA